ncbi:DUF4007 family protein [Sphingobacterium sp. lm-10]|uniref:DUF4007 family protein n=1 Tax=Sphingobacterium sp. lm-10 TaxID=2944904 RepID=UPI0020209E78|nr:DUF4007 family protein [Sphingobacterium sp. lm-10]MCL7987098.1 DUF4007 family protein [Sphingobacterium sp. lm-10]
MRKLSFSGHETFACKIYWLKKGYDFVRAGKRFTDSDAVVDLGVGKNMVASIRFWLKAFGLLSDDDQLTEFADFVFGKNGVDPYLEDPLTLWLLHYQLMKSGKSSIYPLVFNELRRQKNEFTKYRLLNFLKRKIEEQKATFSDATLNSDIKVFFANYTKLGSNDVEDAYSTILFELGLINNYQRLDHDDKPLDVYTFNTREKNIPIEALLFVLLDRGSYGSSISVNHLANDFNSVGNTFLLTESAIIELLHDISSEYGSYSETAGNPVLQLTKDLNKFNVLNNYYKLTYAGV